MNKHLTIAITLLSAITLTACGNRQNNSHKNSASVSTSSKADRHSKQPINSSSNDQTNTNTAADSQTDKLSAQLSDREWYVLAYLDAWGLDSVSAGVSGTGNFAVSSNGGDAAQKYGPYEAAQGTADSSCIFVRTDATSVTIAPSSGEGAMSTYSNKTYQKSYLANKYLKSQSDVDQLLQLTQAAFALGQADEANNSSESSSTDSNESSSNNSQDNQNNDSSSSNNDVNIDDSDVEN